MEEDIFAKRAEYLKKQQQNENNVFLRRAKQLERQNKQETKTIEPNKEQTWKKEVGLLDSLLAQQAQKDVAQQQYEMQRGFQPAFTRGLTSGVSGLLTGNIPESPQEQNFLERLGRSAGEIVSDIPGFITGGAAGSIVGSPIPFIGSAVGGAAGAFGVPALLKSSFNEYRKHVEAGNNLTFGEFLNKAGRVAKETGKSAALGVAVGKAHKLLPFLERIPGFNKLFNTKIGTEVAKTATDVTALTAGQAALEGEIPSGEDIAQNALILLGMKAAGPATKKLGKGFEKIAKPIARVAEPYIKPIAENISKLLPESVKNTANQLISGIQNIKQTAQEKRYFEMLEDHVGKRDARFVRSQFKWNRELDALNKNIDLKKDHLQDMMFYRQKTGNVFKEGDTYQKLLERLPEPAKKFVDTSIDNHFKEMLKTWNENPATKDINPREALEDIYLPGLYQYDPKKFARAYDEVSKQFKTKNPFSNQKKFMTYMDAFQDRGLKPRYNNIIDLMRAYDRIMIKTMGNNELLSEVKKYEKDNKLDLIVNPNNEKAYRSARGKSYVPFDDVFLRRYVSGIDKEGKPVYATSARPAMVHPEFASAFQSIFKKDAFKPGYDYWKAYDSLNDIIRFGRVAMSPFHYVALMESAVGSKGPRALNFKKWLDEAKNLKTNEDFMADAADSGLVVGRIEGTRFEKADKLLDRVLVDTEKGSWQKAQNKFKKGMTYLFDEFHPALKLTTWRDLTTEFLNKQLADGNPLSVKEIKQAKRDIAKHVNNIYGGQRWETIRWLNNPQTMKVVRRLIGYPDWTISAARQAAEAFSPGIRGDLSRKYWVKYGIANVVLRNLMKGLYGGLEQTDENESPLGIRWNSEKAYREFTESDPTQWKSFPLPDIPLKVLGKTFNPGRDSKARRLYSHTGKQALEIGNYFTDLPKTLFSKSAPLIQIAGRQFIGGSPSEGSVFPAQAAFQGGKMVPWGGSEPGSLERLLYRGKDIIEGVLPFAAQNIKQYGVAPLLVTGGGAVPISKGMSLYKAEPLIEKALKAKDTGQLNAIRKTLKDNGYSQRQIKSRISRVRNKLKRLK